MDSSARARSKALPIAIVSGALIIAASVVYVYADRNKGFADPEPQNIARKSENVAPVSEADWVRGNPNATVKVVVFTDFECPFCRQFHQTMSRIIDEYGREGKVAWIYRHFPIAQLHSKAPQEALAAECAGSLGGNLKFWEYADLLFTRGKGNDTLDLSLLPTFAEEIGLSRPAFSACMQEGSLMRNVEEDFQNAVASGGSGTPYSILIVNGKTYTIPGAQPYPAVKAIIDTVLVQAGVTELKPPSQTSPADRIPQFTPPAATSTP